MGLDWYTALLAPVWGPINGSANSVFTDNDPRSYGSREKEKIGHVIYTSVFYRARESNRKS